jgi:outer membrane protein assembly factor BamA
MVDEGISKLEEYYRDNGFLNIRVARELTFSDDFQFVDVVYHVQEGRQFTVKDTAIDGVRALPKEQLGPILRVKNGEYYNEEIVTTVGKVIIVGNSVTKDEIIRRAIGIYPGQVLRFPELRLAEKALARLGIFEMNAETGVKPTVVAIPTDDPAVQDILVVVKETHTGSFQIGAGYNIDNGLVSNLLEMAK